MDDAQTEPRQHEPHRRLRVDARPADAGRVELGHLIMQPAEVEPPLDAGQHVIVGDEVPKRAAHEELELVAGPTADHAIPHAMPWREGNQRSASFSAGPDYRSVSAGIGPARSRGDRVRDCVAAVAASTLMAFTPAIAGEITFASGFSEPAAVDALEQIIPDFEAENPDVTVTTKTVEPEAFKLAGRDWLTTKAADVFDWAASEHLYEFVEFGLVENMSDVWADAGLDETMAGARNAATRDGARFALPVSGAA